MLIKHPSKDEQDMPEKLGQIHERCFRTNSCIWTHQCWLTSKDLHRSSVDTECLRLEYLTEVMDKRDGWRKRKLMSSTLVPCLDDNDTCIYIYNTAKLF